MSWGSGGVAANRGIELGTHTDFFHAVRPPSVAYAAADAPSQAQVTTPAFQTLPAWVRSDCVLATKAAGCILWGTPEGNSWLPNIDVCGFCIGLCGSYPLSGDAFADFLCQTPNLNPKH